MALFLLKITLTFLTLFQQINIESLKKDPILIQYKKVMNELKQGRLDRKYILPTDPNIMKSFYTNPTKENMKTILNKSGMKNANEYVDNVFLQTTLMFDFLKKHPEITKLDQKKKSELINQLIFN